MNVNNQHYVTAGIDVMTALSEDGIFVRIGRGYFMTWPALVRVSFGSASGQLREAVTMAAQWLWRLRNISPPGIETVIPGASSSIVKAYQPVYFDYLFWVFIWARSLQVKTRTYINKTCWLNLDNVLSMMRWWHCISCFRDKAPFSFQQCPIYIPRSKDCMVSL